MSSRSALLVYGCLLVGGVARADDAVTSVQTSAETDYLRKVSAECGTPLSLRYDSASLHANDPAMKYDQASVGLQCNEGLRYLHYACATAAGRTAVERAHITKIVCVGTPGPTASLKIASGTLTISRTPVEKNAWAQLRRQFDAALDLELPLTHLTTRPNPMGDGQPSATAAAGDPYLDEGWRKLGSQPNPPTDDRNVCTLGKRKLEYSDSLSVQADREKRDTTLECWKNGELVTSVVYVHGARTGFIHRDNGDSPFTESYRDDKLDGVQTWGPTKDGQLEEKLYRAGTLVWRKAYYPGKKLERYELVRANGDPFLALLADGKVKDLRCASDVGDDAVLRGPCGYGKESHVDLYETSDAKPLSTLVFKDGQKIRSTAGDTSTHRAVTASYRNGLVEGEEQIFDDNKLFMSTTWSNGKHEGKERVYDLATRKLVSEVDWKNDVALQTTTFFLNGNTKERVRFDGAHARVQTTFWDSGKPRTEGTLRPTLDGRLVKDGAWKSYFESGKPESEAQYAETRLVKRKEWSEDGTLVLDEEYEADGSRKAKH